MVDHRLELQIVIARILEEARVLLAGHALEAQVRLDDKLDLVFLQPIDQRVPLLHGERQTKVRDRNLISIDRIVVISAAVIVAGPVADQLVAVQAIAADTQQGQVSFPACRFGLVACALLPLG